MGLRPEAGCAASSSISLLQDDILGVCYVFWLQLLLGVQGFFLAWMLPRPSTHGFTFMEHLVVNNICWIKGWFSPCPFLSPRTDMATQNLPVLEGASMHVTHLSFSGYSNEYHASWTWQTNHIRTYLRLS